MHRRNTAPSVISTLHRVLHQHCTECCADANVKITTAEINYVFHPLMKKILYVEDDHHLAAPVLHFLEQLSFETKYAGNVDDAFEACTDFQPDLILLDILLNDRISGIELARQFRTNNYNAPIIFISSLDDATTYEHAAQIAATDYIRKPISLNEIAYRTRRMVQHAANSNQMFAAGKIVLGNMTFIHNEQSLIYNQKRIHLSRLESEVLFLLCQHIDQYLPRTQIVKTVWSGSLAKRFTSLNNVLSRLRKKLQLNDSYAINTLGKKLVKIECIAQSQKKEPLIHP